MTNHKFYQYFFGGKWFIFIKGNLKRIPATSYKEALAIREEMTKKDEEGSLAKKPA